MLLFLFPTLTCSNEEFGDLLFVVANIARHLDLDPEASLRAANAKFTKRFQRMEALLAEQQPDRSVTEKTSLELLDTLWVKAKLEEKSKS